MRKEKDFDGEDLGFTGDPFTWSNRREAPYTIRCRLDRFCGTARWRNLFPLAHVHHIEFGGSDHVPILLTLQPTTPTRPDRRGRPFRFEAMWIRREECESIVQNEWSDLLAMDPIEDLLTKTENCKTALLQWSQSSIENPRNRISKVQKRLHELGRGLQSTEIISERRTLQNELEQLYQDLDTYWKQRSRVQWMKEGDRNTGFFHAKATIRKRNNWVHRIKNDLGEWTDNKAEIEQVIANYFSSIFQSTYPTEGVIESVTQHIDRRLSNAASQSLSLPFTADEVTRAISQMSPTKSPGPDGFPVLFFTKYWNCLGSNVLNCVLNFLNNKKLPTKLNYTFIVLIPKVKNPEKITEYRPISLCNVIYKFGSKAIANRIKPFLQNIISPTQSAFVPKRLITDNVLVAYEVNHFIKSNSRKKTNFMAAKLDISKAYDRIEWLFLRKILNRFGFPSSLVDLIMLCVSSVFYYFLFNGCQFGSLQPSRGLRQGDPLSPYLFILCTEALIAMIRQAETERVLHGIVIAPTAPSVSCLSFADDTLVFCKANLANAETLNRILQEYAAASGQVVNIEKSTMCFCPMTPPDTKNAIQSTLGFQIVESHEKYLGMPLTMGKSRRAIFDFLRDRVWTKIEGWGEKQLSKAGKEVLIKAVLQAIPSYLMSCFSLPLGLLHDIESAIQRFWWGNGKARSMAWTSWIKLCTPKERGGMGFRHLRSFNLAMLAKQAWRIISCPDLLLSKLLRARYFPAGNFWSAPPGFRPSATWRSLLLARPHVKAGCRVRIGNGKDTAIWGDPWLKNDGNFHILTRRSAVSAFPNRVSDLILPDSRVWDLDLIHASFWPVDHNRILAIPIGSSFAQDRLVWHYSRSGQFTVKSCYHNIMYNHAASSDSQTNGTSSNNGTKDLWKYIWHLSLPPKIKIFVWRAAWDIIPTKGALFRRHITSDPFCNLCGTRTETTVHALIGCRDLPKVWQSEPFNIDTTTEPVSFLGWLVKMRKHLSKNLLCLAMVICWKAWDSRNREENGDMGLRGWELRNWSEDYLSMYRSACLEPTITKSPAPQVQWTPPPEGIVKVNFDAAFPPSQPHYKVATVARNSDGATLWWSVATFPGHVQPVEGEAHAALFAIQLAHAKGWPSIIIEGDCRQIITALQGEDFLLCPYGAYLEDICTLALSFFSCRFSFVPRSCNKLAHGLAVSMDLATTEGLSLPPHLAYLA
ncbi:PREDICTED: uncharacterized protein LOC105962665 [Erythranthe guttata]|uniref:uncharacterized protein LOC105962665 n=1 Tax=Erythranthe guttata TaxID=4155 RepID=UPI00064D8F08|nr:PREDICTED: uncharacterized protein LOC105962665 [Erythranthe guttata]|eukprot:XP_012842431.1 PREDICTED: uncharacterized protein LOC105962665 [Erythranthe guttata]